MWFLRVRSYFHNSCTLGTSDCGRALNIRVIRLVAIRGGGQRAILVWMHHRLVWCWAVVFQGQWCSMSRKIDNFPRLHLSHVDRRWLRVAVVGHWHDWCCCRASELIARSSNMAGSCICGIGQSADTRSYWGSSSALLVCGRALNDRIDIIGVCPWCRGKRDIADGRQWENHVNRMASVVWHRVIAIVRQVVRLRDLEHLLRGCCWLVRKASRTVILWWGEWWGRRVFQITRHGNCPLMHWSWKWHAVPFGIIGCDAIITLLFYGSREGHLHRRIWNHWVHIFRDNGHGVRYLWRWHRVHRAHYRRGWGGIRSMSGKWRRVGLLRLCELLKERLRWVEFERKSRFADGYSCCLLSHLFSLQVALQRVQEKAVMRNAVPVEYLLLLLGPNAVVLVEKVEKRAFWLLQWRISARLQIPQVGKDPLFEFFGILHWSTERLKAEWQASYDIGAWYVEKIVPASNVVC